MTILLTAHGLNKGRKHTVNRYTHCIYMYDSKNDFNKRYMCHGTKKSLIKNTVFTVDQPKRQIKEIIVEQQQQQQQTKSRI